MADDLVLDQRLAKGLALLRPVNGVFNSGFVKDNKIVNDELVGPETGRYSHAAITDGHSNTIFVGEKYVNKNGYGKAHGWGDGCIYNGDEPETFMRIGGFGMGIAKSSEELLAGQIPVSPGEYPVYGSAHLQVANFLMGDASVHAVSTRIEEETLYRLCARNDGKTVNILGD